MNASAFDRAAAIVRAWTRVYTWTVSPELRERRRREVDADLWEAAHDTQADRSALLLLLRATGGIVDDVRWTLEQPQHAGPLTAVFVTMAVCALAGWLIVTYRMRVTEMPVPHTAQWLARGPFTQADVPVAPPPPPPPPPPLPARRQR